MTDQMDANATRAKTFEGLHAILETGDIADVRAFAAAHGGMKADILDYISEFMALPAAHDEADSDTTTTAALSSSAREALARFWAAQPTTPEDIFAGRNASDLQRIAAGCMIDMSILRKLARRLVEGGTVPGRLMTLLAEAIGRDAAAVYTHLMNETPVQSADRFAPSGLVHGGKVSFAEAVRTSSLDEERKRFWLDKAGG